MPGKMVNPALATCLSWGQLVLVGVWRSLGYGKWTRPKTFVIFKETSPFCLNLLKNLPHLLSQLSHDGVDPGEACGGVRPLGERVVVVVPRDLGEIF